MRSSNAAAAPCACRPILCLPLPLLSVTYDELSSLTRTRLRLKKRDLSEMDLMALWCALDEDDSNQILQDEALRFLKLAPTATKDGFAATNTRAYREKQKAARAKALADKMRQVDAVQSATREMRAALEAEGVPEMTEGYLHVLSDQFNEWLEMARETSSTHDRAFSKVAGQKVSWMLLFKEVDADTSGGITYDEYKRVLRKKLRLSQHDLSDRTMNALWCALDNDNSDQIRIDEFQKFLTGNVAALLKPPKERRRMVRTARSPRREPEDPMAAAHKMEASLEKTAKALKRREKRIEEIQAQLKQIESEIPKPPKLPRSGKSLPSLTQTSISSSSSSRPRSKVGGPYPMRYLDPSQLQSQLKAALLDIARDQFVEDQGGKLEAGLPLPPPPPLGAVPPPPGGRLPPLGLSTTTDDLERLWWEQLHGQPRLEWYSGSMADTLSFRPIPHSRQMQRRRDKIAHGETVTSPRSSHNPSQPPPPPGEPTPLDVRVAEARERLLSGPLEDGQMAARRRLRQSVSAQEIRVYRIRDNSWPQQVGMAAGA